MNSDARTSIPPIIIAIAATVVAVRWPPMARAAEARALHFPSDRSMGTVYVLDDSLLATAAYDDWQTLGEATGTVAIPAGRAVRLNLSESAAQDLSPLARLEPRDLQALSCRSVELADDQLKHVAHLTGLTDIDLSESGILGTGLAHLARLTSLERLVLVATHVGDKELAHLANLASLRRLFLYGTPTGDEGMVHVGKVETLEMLGLSSGVSDKGLAQLRDLANLRWLSTGGSGITDEGLAHLAGLTRMEYLDLRNTRVTDDGLVHVAGMRDLQNLCLYSTRVTEKGFKHLEGLSKLQTLQVLFGATDVGLPCLSKLPALRNVTVDGGSISAGNLALLQEMASLEELYLDNTPKMDALLGSLPELPRLKKLTLGTGLTDEGLLCLRMLPSLEALMIGPSRITGTGLATLTNIPSLRVLELHQADLPAPQDWAALGKLSLLERLELMHTRSKVTDAHVAGLVDLEALEDLTLSAIVVRDRQAIARLDVTDEGLTHLAKLKRLKRLSLTGAPITDEGLQKLATLPQLERLELWACGVTEQGLEQLKQKLPALGWYLSAD